MAWTKPSPDLLDLFKRRAPRDDRVEQRMMFGCPALFVNGNMFAGVHEETIVLRLGQGERDQAMAELGAEPFVPMGRLMREYVVLTDPLRMAEDDIADWLTRALAFASALPVKMKGVRKRPKAT